MENVLEVRGKKVQWLQTVQVLIIQIKFRAFLNTYLQHNPGFSSLHSKSPNSETRQPEFNAQLLQPLALWSRLDKSCHCSKRLPSVTIIIILGIHFLPIWSQAIKTKQAINQNAPRRHSEPSLWFIIQSIHYIIHSSSLQMKKFYTEQIITRAKSGG